MFKTLRNKILLTHLLLTLLVILSTFTVFFLISYSNSNRDAERRLHYLPKAMAEKTVTSLVTPGSVNYYVANLWYDSDYFGSAVFFKITVTSDGKISQSNLNYSHIETFYKQIAYKAWKSKSKFLIISTKSSLRSDWQADIVSNPINPKEFDIYFLDVSVSQSLLRKFFYVFLGVLPISLFLVFLSVREPLIKE